jgi:hypothetical protein
VDIARNAKAVPILVTEGRLVSRNNTADEKKRIHSEIVLLTDDALNHAFEETDRILREVSVEKQVHLIDASSEISGKLEFFLDAVHLRDRGAKALSSIVAKSLAGVLEKQTRTSANVHSGKH